MLTTSNRLGLGILALENSLKVLDTLKNLNQSKWEI